MEKNVICLCNISHTDLKAKADSRNKEREITVKADYQLLLCALAAFLFSFFFFFFSVEKFNEIQKRHNIFVVRMFTVSKDPVCNDL